MKLIGDQKDLAILLFIVISIIGLIISFEWRKANGVGMFTPYVPFYGFVK
jgi:hypothetical protein